MNSHDVMLDNVAAYALGALPVHEAAAMRKHLTDCTECAAEYRRLKPAVDALASSVQASPPARLKMRIMNEVRRDATPRLSNVGEMRAVRPIVWPAYAVAAACLAIALITSIFNISINERARSTQAQLALINAAARSLHREIAIQRTELADLASPASQRYEVEGGEVVRHANRVYIAMNAMAMPPRGKVYQAWVMHTGATRMSPSVTFVPDRSGVAVLPLPVPASAIVEVAVSTEPEGGSKQPTSKPAFVVKLS